MPDLHHLFQWCELSGWNQRLMCSCILTFISPCVCFFGSVEDVKSRPDLGDHLRSTLAGFGKSLSEMQVFFFKLLKINFSLYQSKNKNLSLSKQQWEGVEQKLSIQRIWKRCLRQLSEPVCFVLLSLFAFVAMFSLSTQKISRTHPLPNREDTWHSCC